MKIAMCALYLYETNILIVELYHSEAWFIHQSYLLQNNFKTHTEVSPETFRSHLKMKLK